MRDCDYCKRSFEDEDAYIEHLDADHHKRDLGIIDQHRVSREKSDGGVFDSLPFSVTVVGIVIFGLLIGAGVVLAFSGQFSTSESDLTGDVDIYPTNHGEVDNNAEIELVVDGDAYSLTDDYMDQNDHVYLTDDGGTLHITAEHVTVEYFLASIGMEVGGNDFSYSDGDISAISNDGGSVTVLVNDEEVTPESYEINDGDNIRIEVSTSD